MTLKTKLIILVCVCLAGYLTALKMRPNQSMEVAHNTEKKIKKTKTTKKTFDGTTGKLIAEETTDTIDALLKEKFKATKPSPAPLPDNFIFTFDSKKRVEVLFNPSSILPILPLSLWLGYAKDLRTGEDVYALGYSKRFF